MINEKEYLTVKELADRLGLTRKTVRNKMAAGVFRKGVHYFSPEGLGPRFKWSAVVAWIEGNDNHREYGIPMRGGYNLNLVEPDLLKSKE
jgi:excisionase family DNA binding protein